MMLAAAPLAVAQGADLERAGALVRSGKAAEAYDMLAPLEDRLAGDVNYDYLLGIAALDSGKSDRATIAFERVLAVNPLFAGARLDMARAYFQLGDLSRAKSEFQTVSEQNPPPEVRAVIAKYMEAIDKAEQAKLRSLRGYVEVAAGYDTNVNNSTTRSEIQVPALGNLVFTLSPTNLATRDGFHAFAAGLEYTQQIVPGIAAFVGGDWRKRTNDSADVFDNSSTDLRIGATFGDPEHQLRVTAGAGWLDLDNRQSKHSNSIGADWRYALNPALQLNAFSQYGRQRFTTLGSSVNSFNSVTSGLGALRLFQDGKYAVFGTGFLGEEVDTDRRADGGKAFVGIRVGGQMKLSESLDLFAMLGHTRADYSRANAAFLATRHDETTDLVLGANWRFARDWSLRPQVLESRNSSNIAIYPFQRTEWSLTLRRDLLF